MAQRNDLRPARGSWGHIAKLVRVLNMRLGPGALGQLHNELARRPHRERPMPLPHLDHASSEWRGRRQAVQHAIVGEVAIPADFALFGGKAFPGKRLGQRCQGFLLAALAGPFMGCAMDSAVDALTPGSRLTIEVIDIREGDAWPEILFHQADGALDFSLRLRGIRLADSWSDPNGRHEIREQWVPPRD